MSTKALLTLPEARAAVDIRSTDTSYDTFLTALLLTVSANIEGYIRRPLAEEIGRIDLFTTRSTRTTHYDLRGDTGFGSDTGMVQQVQPQVFFLRGLMPRKDTPLDVRYDPAGTFGDTTKLDASAYRMDWGLGALHLLCGTRAIPLSLQVTYDCGLAVNGDNNMSESAPEEIKLAARFQLAYLFKRARKDNIGHQREIGFVSDKSNAPTIQWNTKMPLCAEAAGMVHSYRLAYAPNL